MTRTIAAIAITLTLTACGSDTPPPDTHQTHDTPIGKVHEARIDFRDGQIDCLLASGHGTGIWCDPNSYSETP